MGWRKWTGVGPVGRGFFVGRPSVDSARAGRRHRSPYFQATALAHSSIEENPCPSAHGTQPLPTRPLKTPQRLAHDLRPNQGAAPFLQTGQPPRASGHLRRRELQPGRALLHGGRPQAHVEAQDRLRGPPVRVRDRRVHQLRGAGARVGTRCGGAA